MENRLFTDTVRKRKQLFITYNNITKTLREWSKQCVIDPKTLRDRIVISKWSIHKALTYPKPKYRELHGMRNSITYTTWNEMKRRCYQTQYKDFHLYGGRGITVCDEWRHSLLTFIRDMGERPNRNMTIERISNNGNYEKSNCKWATKAEQMRNTKQNVNISYNGITMCRVDWEKRAGLPKHTIRNRMKNGWSFEKAYITPINTDGATNVKHITYNGVTLSRTEWNKKAGLTKRLIAKRMDRGWTFEEAYLTPYKQQKGIGY